MGEQMVRIRELAKGYSLERIYILRDNMYEKKIFGRLINRAMNIVPINVIKERVKHLFTNLIPQWVFKSYSQYCEDLIIDCLVNNKQFGVYLDVGANDPNVFSNTKRFYQRGWSGVNIEPDTKLYAKLCRYRPRDINVNIGIGSIKGKRTFYEMSADTLSTFSEEEVHRLQREGYELVTTHTVPILPLCDILQCILLISTWIFCPLTWKDLNLKC